MSLFALWQQAAGLHFDATISMGNVLTMLTFFFLGLKFWSAQVATKKDLEWRIANLETWRKEHSVDADSRDNMLDALGKIVERLDWVEEAREKAANAPLGKRRLNDT